MHYVKKNEYKNQLSDAEWGKWQAHVSPFFDLSPRSETVLNADIGMTTLHLDSMLVGEVRAPAQDLVRSPLKVAQQGIDHIVMQFYGSGRSDLRVGARDASVGSRDAVIYDLSQPIDVRSDQPVDAINVLFPREALAAEIGVVDGLHGTSINHHRDPAARLFRDYIAGVAHCGAELQTHQVAGVSQAALKLCGAFLRAPDDAAPARSADARIEIRDFIHRNLTDPALCVDGIVERFGISRPVLYRQFSEEAGVQSYIRERRLRKAMRLLTRADPKGRPRVSSVAYAVGFLDEKTFSRAFKNRFGFLPREIKMGEFDGDTKLGSENELLVWIKDLAL